jgi:hypothetical protein
MGPKYASFENSSSSLLLNIYLHGIELVFVIIDFLWSKHKFKSEYCKDVVIFSVSFSIYIAVLFMGKYAIAYNAYNFLIDAEIKPLVVTMIIFFFVILNYYAMYQCLVQRKSENKKLTGVNDNSTGAFGNINRNIGINKIPNKFSSKMTLENEEKIIINRPTPSQNFS